MDDSGQLFLLLTTTAAAFTVAINTRELSTITFPLRYTVHNRTVQQSKCSCSAKINKS